MSLHGGVPPGLRPSPWTGPGTSQPLRFYSSLEGPPQSLPRGTQAAHSLPKCPPLLSAPRPGGFAGDGAPEALLT